MTAVAARAYCADCYGSAAKAGRDVHLSVLDGRERCGPCEQHRREGFVKAYFPNGTALECFLAACFECRHYIDDLENPKPGTLEPPHTCCAWGVLDRVYAGMAENDRAHAAFWHRPEDLQEYDGGEALCPPRCLRFTRKDYDLDDRDPPRPDAPGQLTFEDALEVPERSVLSIDAQIVGGSR